MDYQYIFFGQVYPQRVGFSLKGVPPRKYDFPDFKLEGLIRDLTVVNCKLSYVFESNVQISTNTDLNVETVKNLTERVIRVYIDSYCFVNSYSYDIVIDKVVCESLKLDYTFPVIGEFKLEKNLLDFPTIIRAHLQINSPSVGDALSDFRRSIKYPTTTAYYCHRAIETLRKAFFDDENIEDYNIRVKKGWILMSKNIGISKDSIYEKLLTFAKQNRHGDYPQVSYEERLEFMTFARKVINAFIVWKYKETS